VRDEKWDTRFLKSAEFVAQMSKDPSTKVGALIADGKRIVSVGYNGFPMGVHDTEERLTDRDLKYKMVVHAEVNAILFAKRCVDGLTLYTWPFQPCSSCAGIVINSGIKTVVAPFSDNPRWVENFAISQQMFREAGVELVLLNHEVDI
jgi:dCMP deaminase